MTDTDAEQTLAEAWQAAATSYRAYAAKLEAANAAQAAEILRLHRLTAEMGQAYATLYGAYVKRTQSALAAGLLRYVVTGDKP